MCCKHDPYAGSANRVQGHDRQGIGCLQRASARRLASSAVLHLVERDIDLPDRARRYAAVLHKLAKQLALRDRRGPDPPPRARPPGLPETSHGDTGILPGPKKWPPILS